MNGESQPSIDERLQAVAQNLELLSVNIHAMQDEMRGMREETREYKELQAQLDARERRGREALLSGIAAYLRALRGDDEDQGERAQ